MATALTNEKVEELIRAINALSQATDRSAGTISGAASRMGSAVARGGGGGGGSAGGGGGSAGGGGGISGSGTNIGVDFSKAFSGVGDVVDYASGAMDRFMGGVDGIAGAINQLRTKMSSGAAAFAQSSGMADMAGKAYSGVAGTLKGLGMGYEGAAQHMGSLINQIPKFLDMSAAEQKSIGLQSGMLSRLGVDVGTYSTNFKFMQNSLNMSAPAIKNMNTQLYGLSRSLKMPPGVIMKDFAEAMPKLVAFGNKAPDIFAKAENYAKKLGISMSTITKQIDQFDSFESAAQAAGNLNVIMRQNLFDTQELLYATPEEKVKIFTGALEKYKNTTGKSFDEMDVFMKKSIAQQSGFTIEELSNMSKHSASELDKLDKVKLADKGGAAMEKTMRKNAAATVDLNTQLQNMADTLTAKVMPLGAKFGENLQNSFKLASEGIDKFMEILNNNPKLKSIMTKLVSSAEVKKVFEQQGITGDSAIITQIMKMATSPLPKELADTVIPQLNKALIGLGAAGVDSMKDLSGPDGFQKAIQGMMGGVKPEELAGAMSEVGGILKDGTTGIASALKFDPADAAKMGEGVQSVVEAAKNAGVGFGNEMTAMLTTFGDTYATAMGQMGPDPSMNPMTKFLSATNDATVAMIDNIGQGFTQNGQFGQALNNVFVTGAGTIAAASNNMFTSIGDSFANFSSSPARDSLVTSVTTGGGQLVNTIVETLTAVFAGGAAAIGAAVSGPTADAVSSGVRGAIGNARPTTGDSGNVSRNVATINNSRINESNAVQVERLIQDLRSLNTITINPALITGIDKLALSIRNLNPSLEMLERNRNNLFLTLSSVTEVEVQRIGNLSAIIERYAEALRKARMYSDENDKIKAVLQDVGRTVATAIGDIGMDGTALGQAMATPIVNAIRGLYR